MTRQTPRKLAYIVAGPTCSGKSAFAIDLAERLGGSIINADAMQVYRELRILTARPTPADEARVPHMLYGVRPAAMPGTVAWWRSAALDALQAAAGVPILCGGTGMYLNSLLLGLADIPDPGPAAQAEARSLLACLGAPLLHERLASADPETAARLAPGDGQRVARAWEVWRGTGRGLAAWQADPASPPAPYRFRAIVLDPPRAVLREAIGRRWTGMLDQGALEEVRALRGQRLAAFLPAMRAHGVPELCGVLDGHWELPEAGRRALLAIGRYTRRQATWLRHHALADPADTIKIDARYLHLPQHSMSNMPGMLDFLSLAG